MAQATYPKVRRAEQARKSLPIWSCSVWGLPCPTHYCAGGALLPHLFTLTSALRLRRYAFCCAFRLAAFHAAIPDVIRHTALWSSDFPLAPCEASDHPVQYQLSIL